jgi:hypothetical protein
MKMMAALAKALANNAFNTAAVNRPTGVFF